MASTSYGYDGFRNRVKKLENMTDTRYINDMTIPYNNLLDTNGKSFVWGNGLIAAKGQDEFYYLQDHLGSPVRLLGKNQEDVLGFDEFGVPTTEPNVNQPFGFTGYQFDSVSGLQYAQARFYSPILGRFSAEDPIKDQFNWYDYCIANPIKFIDPSGLMVPDDWHGPQYGTTPPRPSPVRRPQVPEFPNTGFGITPPNLQTPPPAWLPEFMHVPGANWSGGVAHSGNVPTVGLEIITPEVASEMWNELSQFFETMWSRTERAVEAATHSTSLTVEMGMGFGGSINKKGTSSANFIFRDAMVSTIDSSGWSGWTWDHRNEISVLFNDSIGFKFKDGEFVPITKLAEDIGFNSDNIVSFGKSNYKLILFGYGFEVNFNVSEFQRIYNSLSDDC